MTLDSLIYHVAEKTKTTIEQIKSPSRKAEIVKARQIFVAIAKGYGYKHRQIMPFINRTYCMATHSANIARWQLQKEVEDCRQSISYANLIAHVGRRAQKRRELREYFEKHPISN